MTAARKVRLRITCDGATALRETIDRELATGTVLVRVPPPDGLEYGETVALEVGTPIAQVTLEVEVVSLLPAAGVAVRVASDLAALRALAAEARDEGSGAVTHEIPADAVSSTAPAAPPSHKPTVAERIRLALHGTRDDRAALLREQDKSLHLVVLKSPKVTIDEVATWARSPQMGPEFLKAIGDRKEWLSRPSVAQSLIRNPKTPPDLAIRALDHVGIEMLRQIAKGQAGTVAPFITAAAKKKVQGK